MNKSFRTKTQREKALLCVFPAAIVLAIYAILFAIPLQRERAAAEADFHKAQRASVSPAVAERSFKTLVDEKSRLRELESNHKSSLVYISDRCKTWRSGKSRLATLETITTFMREFNLSILSQGRDDGLVVSSYQQELFKSMNVHTPLNPVEFWNVQVKGAYGEVSSFLNQIDKMENPFIPVAITMAGSGTDKTWTIVFAI